MRFPALLASAVLLVACSNDLDTSRCDEGMARRLVYLNSDQSPAYAGQAQMIASCELCHVADEATTTDFSHRHGAPQGLNWGLTLANGTAASTQRLRAGQQLAFDLRGDIWGQVNGGSMPPLIDDAVTGRFDPAMTVVDPSNGWHYADGSPLQSLRTPEGREVLRNWLACKLPVVERTDENHRPDGEALIGAVELCEYGPCGICMRDADCFGGFACDMTLNRCELKSDWPSIYQGFIQPTCAVSGCHADPAHVSGMVLSATDSAMARTALVGQPSTSPACGSPGLMRVAASDPDHSLLLAKLVGHFGDGSDVCGPVMPLGTSAAYADDDLKIIAGLRAWIAAGALP